MNQAGHTGFDCVVTRPDATERIPIITALTWHEDSRRKTTSILRTRRPFRIFGIIEDGGLDRRYSPGLPLAARRRPGTVMTVGLSYCRSSSFFLPFFLLLRLLFLLYTIAVISGAPRSRGILCTCTPRTCAPAFPGRFPLPSAQHLSPIFSAPPSLL